MVFLFVFFFWDFNDSNVGAFNIVPEKAIAPHSNTLAWKIPWAEEPGWAAVHGVAKSRTRLSDCIFTFHFHALEKEMAVFLPGESQGWRSLVGCRL